MSSEEKPLITISGNPSLVTDQLAQQITRDLPQEGVEWQRSYGRTSKIVYLEAKFVELEDRLLSSDTNELQLLSRPLLHTYWTDCSDVETYKNQTKDEINDWLQKLKLCGITDWFVIVVENTDRKGINKSKLLPTIKTSVLDKIKNDFPVVKASIERTISLSKSTDSYQQLVSRFRALLLHSYSKQLLRYEDYIRTVREGRNAPNWHFLDFFRLQEELAFAFEMLSLYDEALVQYDELDALFSQFVINSNVGPMPQWLSRLSLQTDQWHGLCLSPKVSKELRDRLTAKDIALIELRNYLFGRQSQLLFLLNKPWELASRALPFLQNCVNELNILEISVSPGGMACWVFLSALEILHKCERYSDSSQMESYSRHTVGLWSYARNKLSELGSLCGLMPGMTMTSDHLQKVVELIAGMGTDPRIGEVPMSPQERLKEALSGQEAFLKHYLEISELTMGTFKHIGRMRFARLIGKELSELYIQLEKPQKAMPFLLDLEKVYLREKWPQLLNEIRLLLLSCYQMTSDSRREFKVRCQLSANNLLDDTKRLEHCLEAEKLLQTIDKNSNESLNIRMEGIVEIKDISLELMDNFTVTNRDIQLDLQLMNNFPKDIHCKRLIISLKVEQNSSNSNLSKHKTAVNCCPHMTSPTDAKPDTKPSDQSLSREKPSISTFHSSISVGVKCQNSNRALLRRTDSHGFAFLDKEPEVADTAEAFAVDDLILKPGLNNIALNYKTKESATYILNQIIINLNSCANLIASDIGRHICFAVIAEEPSLKVLQLTTLEGLTNDILCGVEQSVVLELNCGSSGFPGGLALTVQASRGLQLKLETDLTPSPLSDQIQVPLTSPLNPFDIFEIPIVIKSNSYPQKDSNSVEHELMMSWVAGQDSPTPVTKRIAVTFNLMAPFTTTHKLHTCAERKFVEVLVTGLSKPAFILSEPVLTLPEHLTSKLELDPRLPKTDSVLNHSQTVHFLWELIPKVSDSVTNRLMFNMKYKLFEEKQSSGLIRSQWERFECEYKLTDYHTLYMVRECIEPQTGTEFLRAGTLCHLNVCITRVKTSEDHNSIMYEIISDQTLWSLCGKTAGVVAIDGQTDNYDVTFEVMPLISGFLPFPTIRLSKYISSGADKSVQQSGQQTEAKLLAFESGQVYNWSRATQVHVLPSSQLIVSEVQ